MEGCTEGNGSDAETGQKCPGNFFEYNGCKITEGSYREFKIGMKRNDTFSGICDRSLLSDFRFILIETDATALPVELVAKYNPLFELFPQDGFPNGTASLGADTFEEFCGFSDVEPFAKVIAIRLNNLFGPAVINLYFEDDSLAKITLWGHTIEL